MLVGEGLHGCAHLLKLLVTGIGCVPAIHIMLAVGQMNCMVFRHLADELLRDANIFAGVKCNG